MDLKKLDIIAAAEKGITFFIQDADDCDTDIEISVVGVGSRVYKEANKKVEAARAIAMKRNKPIDADQEEELLIEMFAKCTTGWKNIEESGKEIPFNFDNAIDVYTKYPFIRSQVINKVYGVREMLGELNGH